MVKLITITLRPEEEEKINEILKGTTFTRHEFIKAVLRSVLFPGEKEVPLNGRILIRGPHGEFKWRIVESALDKEKRLKKEAAERKRAEAEAKGDKFFEEVMEPIMKPFGLGKKKEEAEHKRLIEQQEAYVKEARRKIKELKKKKLPIPMELAGYEVEPMQPMKAGKNE